MDSIKGKIRDEHMVVLRKSPFWLIIKEVKYGHVAYDEVRKYGPDIRKIIDCYDRRSRIFRFCALATLLVDNNVKLVFGITDGETPISIKGLFKQTSFLERCFPDKVSWMSIRPKDRGADKRLTPAMISNRLNDILDSRGKHEVDDVARLLTMHILATFLVTPDSSFLSWGYTTLLDDLDKTREYNWSGHIFDIVLGSIGAEKKNHSGCFMFLLFWLCGRTNLIKPSRVDALSRFMKWNLVRIHNTIKKTNLGDLKPNDVVTKTLKAFEDEMKHIVHVVVDDASIQQMTTDSRHDRVVSVGHGEPTTDDDNFVDLVPSQKKVNKKVNVVRNGSVIPRPLRIRHTIDDDLVDSEPIQQNVPSNEDERIQCSCPSFDLGTDWDVDGSIPTKPQNNDTYEHVEYATPPVGKTIDKDDNYISPELEELYVLHTKMTEMDTLAESNTMDNKELQRLRKENVELLRKNIALRARVTELDELAKLQDVKASAGKVNHQQDVEHPVQNEVLPKRRSKRKAVNHDVLISCFIIC